MEVFEAETQSRWFFVADVARGHDRTGFLKCYGVLRGLCHFDCEQNGFMIVCEKYISFGHCPVVQGSSVARSLRCLFVLRRLNIRAGVVR